MGTTLIGKQIADEYAKLFKQLNDPEFIKQQEDERIRKNKELEIKLRSLMANADLMNLKTNTEDK